jgi:hypothetical protein
MIKVIEKDLRVYRKKYQASSRLASYFFTPNLKSSYMSSFNVSNP